MRSKSILLFLYLLVLAIGPGAVGQNRPEKLLKGRILDFELLPIQGAAVFVPRLQKGTLADSNGSFRLQLPPDTFTIRISAPGYQEHRQTINMAKNQTLGFRLEPVLNRDVVIDASRNAAQEKVQSTQTSVESLSMREAKELPALFGEVDIIKTLQLKPGVQSGGEGTSGLYIRGGGPDQNLVLVDGTPVYNASHLFGFFSVFNGDAVKGVDLYKGGFPAQYGGRLSSVVDVKMKDGDREKYVVNGGIGLISSRLSVEGPIQKGKSSFIFAARRTYFDVFTRAYNKKHENNPRYNPIPDYYFYDLNGKLSFEMGPRDKLFVTGYYGRDVFGFKRNAFNFSFDWGNTILGTRWSHTWRPSLFLNTSFNYSDYNYLIANQFDSFKFQVGSGVTDYIAKSELNWLPNENHNMLFGASYTFHGFQVGRASGGSTERSFSFNVGQTLASGEGGIYFNDDMKLSERWQLNAGTRLSTYASAGTFYAGLEPRVSARYSIGENTAVKASFARMYQYTHLVSSSGVSIPTDVWYPSNNTVKPQISDQLATGFSHTFGNGMWLFSNELYYKNMQRQIDFKDGANLFVNNRLDTVFVFGRGWAYGSEFYLEKRRGRLTGWIGYTLAYTWRQFGDINNGAAFHPRYDRRHDVSVVAIYKLNKRVSLSATWVYNSGQAVTLPTGRYFSQDIVGTTGQIPGFSVVPITTSRSNVRMDSYHRLDLAMVYRFFNRYGESDLTFSVYNAYSRLNPYFLYILTQTTNPDGNGNITGFQAKQVSLFPLIPSVTYNFKF